MADDALCCSFCMKSQHKAFLLIAGVVPNSFICDECHALCVPIILEHRIRKVVRELTGQGMETAAAGETAGLDPKGDSPVGEADGPRKDCF